MLWPCLIWGKGAVLFTLHGLWSFSPKGRTRILKGKGSYPHSHTLSIQKPRLRGADRVSQSHTARELTSKPVSFLDTATFSLIELDFGTAIMKSVKRRRILRTTSREFLRPSLFHNLPSIWSWPACWICTLPQTTCQRYTCSGKREALQLAFNTPVPASYIFF